MNTAETDPQALTDMMVGRSVTLNIDRPRDVGAPVEDLDDLHGLLLGDGHVVDLLVGRSVALNIDLGRVQIEAVPVADGLYPALRGLDIQLPGLLQAQDDILRGGEHVHQLVVLVRRAADHAGRRKGHRDHHP